MVSARLSVGVLKTRRDARIKLLGAVGPVLQGSLSEIGVTCGNPNCKCARGEKHRSHVLTKKVRGRTKSLYVPLDMVGEVREWLDEHRRVKALLKEISELNEKIIRSHVSTRRAVKANQAAAARSRPPTDS